MKKRKQTSYQPLIVVAVIAGLALAAFWAFRHPSLLANLRNRPDAPAVVTVAPTAAVARASVDRVDPANDERSVDVAGRVHASTPVRDAQLGISVDALVLLRRVEMLQWQQKCAGAQCDYALVWSAEPIDSGSFRVRQGHENPPRFPFTSSRFVAESLRMGAFDLDPALIDTTAAVAYPVKTGQLHANLAATFREQDGRLYSGSDPAHGSAGDLRVSYQVVPAGERRFTALQRGHRLMAKTRSAAPAVGED